MEAIEDIVKKFNHSYSGFKNAAYTADIRDIMRIPVLYEPKTNTVCFIVNKLLFPATLKRIENDNLLILSQEPPLIPLVARLAALIVKKLDFSIYVAVRTHPVVYLHIVFGEPAIYETGFLEEYFITNFVEFAKDTFAVVPFPPDILNKEYGDLTMLHINSYGFHGRKVHPVYGDAVPVEEIDVPAPLDTGTVFGDIMDDFLSVVKK